MSERHDAWGNYLYQDNDFTAEERVEVKSNTVVNCPIDKMKDALLLYFLREHVSGSASDARIIIPFDDLYEASIGLNAEMAYNHDTNGHDIIISGRSKSFKISTKRYGK